MAIRQVRIGSMENIHQYDDADFAAAINTDDQPIEIGQAAVGTQAARYDQIPGAVFLGVGGAVTVVTALQAGGVGPVGFQYKNRVLTFTSGILTTIGAESGWNDV